jgi:hypothetical protein
MSLAPQTIDDDEAPEGGWLLLEPEDCPLRAQHTPRPEGFLPYVAWAEAKSRTHRQLRCAGCHRWAIWVPK